ncbi:MAG TPA: PH domain-containing protein [Steroidobacteraceae bacterium]|jgi:hypothetical protein|nr:PH domain-containing protein [Steroidobacteraceae bacterium]
MPQRFHSRIDGQFALLGVGLPVSLALALAANHVLYGAPPWWALLPLLLAVSVVVWSLTSTTYTFAGATLLVRCGPFRWRVPVEQIFAVSETDSVRSAPAMSMDRLEIRFANDGRMLISPRDKAEFLAELHRQAPQLANHGRSAHPAI